MEEKNTQLQQKDEQISRQHGELQALKVRSWVKIATGVCSACMHELTHGC